MCENRIGKLYTKTKQPKHTHIIYKYTNGNNNNNNNNVKRILKYYYCVLRRE